jgi:broad specificity phosphatase PhoE
MLVLVRHGESEANASGLLVGRQDSPLSARGRLQAELVAPLLGEVSAMVSSPLSRARETAKLVARAKGGSPPIVVDDRWVEVDYGDFDGRRLEEVPQRVWNAWMSDPGFRPPGVEGACLEIFSPGSPGRDPHMEVVVVSHVSPIKAALAWALGTGVEISWRIHLATASVSRIGWGEGRPVVHQLGVLGAARAGNGP